MNNTLQGFGWLLGRVFLALIFILTGFQKIGDPQGTMNYMQQHGMPAVTLFLVGAIVFEIGGGLSLLFGIRARLGALALFLMLIPTTLVFHGFWAVSEGEQGLQMVMFLKNLAIMGGLLVVAAAGAGPMSVDARGAKA